MSTLGQGVSKPDAFYRLRVPSQLAESNAQLESLIAKTMVETDPIKYDELCAEIWRVLDERERFSKEPVLANTATH